MTHHLKIVLTIGLFFGLLYGAEEQSNPGNAGFITVQLADGDVALNKEQWELLLSKSKMLQDMVSEIGTINSSLPLPGIKSETFALVVKVLEQANATEILDTLSYFDFKQQLDLWGCANLLDMPSFLSPLNTIIAHKFTENKYNLLTQFMTNPAGTIALLTSYGIDIASHDIGYIMIEPYLNLLWGSKFKKLNDYENVYVMVWSPDGKMIAFDSGDTISIWDVQNGKELHKLEPHTNARSLQWSPDGKMIASNLGDVISIWDVKSGKELHKLEPHENVHALSWSPNGEMIAYSTSTYYSYRGTVHVWDVKNGKELHKLEHQIVDSLEWSPDGTMIAYDENMTVHIWDVQKGTESLAIERRGLNFVYSLQWSPDGTMIAYGSSDGAVYIWDVQNGIELHKLMNSAVVNSLAWSPDGTKIAYASGETIYIWDVQKKTELHKLEHRANVDSLAWSSNGKMIASIADRAMYIWNVQNGKELSGGIDSMSALAWSPDDTKIAFITATSYRSIRIIDIQPLFFAQRITLIDALILIAAEKKADWPQSEQARELIASRPWYASFRRQIEENKGTITASDIFDLIIQYEEDQDKKYKEEQKSRYQPSSSSNVLNKE